MSVDVSDELPDFYAFGVAPDPPESYNQMHPGTYSKPGLPQWYRFFRPIDSILESFSPTHQVQGTYPLGIYSITTKADQVPNELTSNNGHDSVDNGSVVDTRASLDSVTACFNSITHDAPASGPSDHANSSDDVHVCDEQYPEGDAIHDDAHTFDGTLSQSSRNSNEGDSEDEHQSDENGLPSSPPVHDKSAYSDGTRSEVSLGAEESVYKESGNFEDARSEVSLDAEGSVYRESDIGGDAHSESNHESDETTHLPATSLPSSLPAQGDYYRGSTRLLAKKLGADKMLRPWPVAHKKHRPRRGEQNEDEDEDDADFSHIGLQDLSRKRSIGLDDNSDIYGDSDEDQMPPRKIPRSKGNFVTKASPAAHRTLDGQMMLPKERLSGGKMLPGTQTSSDMESQGIDEAPSAKKSPSTKESLGRRKRAWDAVEESAIEHELRRLRDEEKEQGLTGKSGKRDSKLWKYISDVLLSRHQIDRSPMACKYYWGRHGRAKTGFDERAEKDPTRLATSVQTKRAS